MNWRDLIFSPHPILRRRRHGLFWAAWLIYFATTFFFTQQHRDHTAFLPWILGLVTKSFFLLLSHAHVTYVFIYLVLPRYILPRRYLVAVAVFVVSGSVCIVWSYFGYAVLFPMFDTVLQLKGGPAKNLLIWSSITAGFISALKVMAAATIVKLLKQWHFKQKENELLEKEKSEKELQLLKAQIHPPVLFTTLEKIHSYAASDTTKAANLLLRLSDLLSFVLYDCEESQIPLEKEIEMLGNYVSLEKLRLGSQLELGLSVKGDAGELTIAPLLLLPFLEQSFELCNEGSLEKQWVDLDIRMEGKDLTMKLINGCPAERPMYPSSIDLTAVEKRLLLLYPERHSIREQTTQEMKMILVKIQLGEADQVNTKTDNHLLHSKTAYQ